MTQRIDETITVTLSREWTATFHTDGSLDADPCPVCNTEGFFNIAGVFESQHVAKAGESHEGAIGSDDLWFDRLTYVSCGECETVLFDGEDDCNV